MANITLKGNPIHTSGHLLSLQIKAPDFKLIDKNLKEHTLHEFQGKKKILATVPSLDTDVCSLMTKHLNEFAKKNSNVIVIIVSSDLPFAQKRFCEKEEVHNVITLSTMRGHEFGKSYGILIEDGPLAGILARSIIVLDEKDHVLYTELVAEITHEPNYHKAFEHIHK